MSYASSPEVVFAEAPLVPSHEPWDAPTIEDLERLRLRHIVYLPYEWGKRARVAMLGTDRVSLGLGAYLGLDKAQNDPFVKSVAAHRADPLSDDARRDYGQIAGSAGGAAACTAAGAPAAAPLCAWLGGKVGAWIGENLRFAQGAGMEELVADTWNNVQGPIAQRARKRQIAARAVLTLRDSLISEMALRLRSVDRDTALAWADDMLSRAGAPIPDAWRPVQSGTFCHDETVTAKQIADAKAYCGTWKKMGQTAPGCDDIPAAPGPRRVCQTRENPYRLWTDIQQACAAGGFQTTEDSIRKKLGIPCEPYYFPLGPASPPDAPLDWSSVGADPNAEATARALADRLEQLAPSMLAQATSTDHELQNQAAIRADVEAGRERIEDGKERGARNTKLLNAGLFLLGAGAVGLILLKGRR